MFRCLVCNHSREGSPIHPCVRLSSLLVMTSGHEPAVSMSLSPSLEISRTEEKPCTRLRCLMAGLEAVWGQRASDLTVLCGVQLGHRSAQHKQEFCVHLFAVPIQLLMTNRCKLTYGMRRCHAGQSEAMQLELQFDVLGCEQQ